MSEIKDYERSIKRLSIAELMAEKDKWKKQQSEATGEYGYWGGINGEEIVDAELGRRTGQEYTVRKEFIDATGFLRREHTSIFENQIPEEMKYGLRIQGYIWEKGEDDE